MASHDKRLASLAGGLPVAIVVFLYLSLEMLMKGTEFSRETAVIGVVGFSSHEALQFFDVVEGVPDCVVPDLRQRLHWS